MPYSTAARRKSDSLSATERTTMAAPINTKAGTITRPNPIRSASRPAVTAFFATMTYGAILAFVALHAADQGVGNVGLFFTVYAVFLTVIRPPAGRITVRLSLIHISEPTRRTPISYAV